MSDVGTVSIENMKLGLRVAIGGAFKDLRRIQRSVKLGKSEPALIAVARDQLRELMAAYRVVDEYNGDERWRWDDACFSRDVREAAQ